MFLLQNVMLPKSLPSLPSFRFGPNLPSFSPISCSAVSKTSGSPSDSDSSSISKPKPKSKPRTSRQQRTQDSGGSTANSGRTGTTSSVPGIIPRKPRRGRRSEAAAVEDFVRDSLERTFASIKQQNPEILESRGNIIKEKVVDDKIDSDTSDDDDDDDDEEEEEEEGVVGDGRRRGRKKKMVVEDESSDWPLDADIGWGIRASEYFEQHPIKNIVGEDGEEIDWEGEMDDNWVNEINSLQWESYAFHPSPLVVLVFERYKRSVPV